MKPILIHVIFDRIHRIWEVEQVSFPLPGLDQCDEHIESIAFKGVAFRRHQAIDFLGDAAVITLGLASIVSYWRCVPMNRFTSAGVAQSLRCIPAKRGSPLTKRARVRLYHEIEIPAPHGPERRIGGDDCLAHVLVVGAW
jgi:hypothetical protein